MGNIYSTECLCRPDDLKLTQPSSNDDVWYDCESGFDADVPAPANMIEMGVPAEAAEGVASLAVLVGASGMEPLCDPLTLLRFYISSKGKLDDAVAMYEHTLKWRSEFSIGFVMAMHGSGETYRNDGSPSHPNGHTEWQWERGVPTLEGFLYDRLGFTGRLKELSSVDGGPIMVWRVGICDMRGLAQAPLSIEATKRGLVAHVEDCFQCCRAASLRRKQVVMARVVIDAYGLDTRCFKYEWLCSELLSCILQYPEYVSTVTMVRAPWWATTLWRFLNMVLPPEMSKKLAVLGNDFAKGLKEHSGLDIQVLPEFLGGQASDNLISSAGRLPPGIEAAFRATQGKIIGVPCWFSTTPSPMVSSAADAVKVYQNQNFVEDAEAPERLKVEEVTILPPPSRQATKDMALSRLFGSLLGG